MGLWILRKLKFQSLTESIFYVLKYNLLRCVVVCSFRTKALSFVVPYKVKSLFLRTLTTTLRFTLHDLTFRATMNVFICIYFQSTDKQKKNRLNIFLIFERVPMEYITPWDLLLKKCVNLV